MAGRYLSYSRKTETKIRLKNIQLYGWHGIADKEKKMGQRFEIDIEVSASLDSAIDSDDINLTVNYSDLYDKVVSIFLEKKYNLIESLAKKIARSIIKEFNVADCKVTIRKPDAPINGILEAVEVEVNSTV